MIRISVTDEHAIPQLQSYLSRLGWLAVAREAGALEAQLPGVGSEHAELQELVGYLQAWQLRHPQVSLQLAPENSLAPTAGSRPVRN